MMAAVAGLFLALPLAAWALIARTWLIGLTVAVALLGCGAGWLLIADGYAGPASSGNAMVALAVLTVLLLVAGLLTERRIARQPAHGSRLLCIAGTVVFTASIAVNALVVLALETIPRDNANYTPPSSDVVPLPAGLKVVSDQDLGCQGSGGYCTRQVEITSTTGLSASQAAQLIAAGLHHLHGWAPDADQHPVCRTEGLALGSQHVCIEVEPTTPVTVLLGNHITG
jgi:hypothetical protein